VSEFPSGLDGAAMPATLERLYPAYELLRWAGHVHPITVFPSTPEKRGLIETPLGALSGDEVFKEDYYSPEWHPRGRAALRSEIERAKSSGHWNGATYALTRLRTEDGSVRLDASPGRYFQNMVTSDALDIELSAALDASQDQHVPLAAMPLRAWLTKLVEDPVIDGSHRSAALSLSATVIVKRRKGGYSIILSPRSDKVRRHMLFNHVAPSGVIQPPRGRDDLWRDWFCVKSNFLAEFIGELYGGSLQDEPDITEDLVSQSRARRLIDLIEGGGASLFYTGVSINLLMLRPEICLALLVHDEDWLAREAQIEAGAFKLGQEFLAVEDASQLPAGRTHFSLLYLDDDFQPTDNGIELRPSTLVPQAAASMYLGTEALRHLDDN
jgi:hypothetical protein